jgi:hypothetical protein
MTVRDHLPPEAQAFFGRDRRLVAEQAQRVGRPARSLIERLLADNMLERLRAAQGVIGWARPMAARLEAACARALAMTARTTAPSRRSWPPGADQATPMRALHTPRPTPHPLSRDAASRPVPHPPTQQDLLH